MPMVPSTRRRSSVVRSWLNKDAYDIEGKAPDDIEAAFQNMKFADRNDQVRMMPADSARRALLPQSAL